MVIGKEARVMSCELWEIELIDGEWRWAMVVGYGEMGEGTRDQVGGIVRYKSLDNKYCNLIQLKHHERETNA
jgi:hypothetical protein